MCVNIKNLSFKYNKKDTQNVLSDLSLNIKPNKITVLLGLNGCGKTTLIKLLVGLLQPDDGTIYYGEQNLSNISIKNRSKIFSYVSQKNYAAEDILVRDFLTYGFINSTKFYEKPTMEHMQRIQKIAEKMHIENLLDKELGKLSGGEHQIVSIACCLLQEAPIIILDEPMSALDLNNQEMVMRVLMEVCGEGKTVILSTHNPNHALYLNADVALLQKGKLVNYGFAQNIINVENLTPLYGDSIILSKDLPYNEVSIHFNEERKCK